jgi:hypothetical protein
MPPVEPFETLEMGMLLEYGLPASHFHRRFGDQSRTWMNTKALSFENVFTNDAFRRIHQTIIEQVLVQPLDVYLR